MDTKFCNGYKIGWQDGFYFGKRSFKSIISDILFENGYFEGFKVGYRRRKEIKESKDGEMQE